MPLQKFNRIEYLANNMGGGGGGGGGGEVQILRSHVHWFKAGVDGWVGVFFFFSQYSFLQCIGNVK